MPSDDNVTPLRSVDQGADGAEATEPQPETFAGPGWTGQTVYPDGAPPRVASSDAPPAETMPSAAAEGAREDLDDAAAELARRVHGPEVPAAETHPLEVADPVEPPPLEPGTLVVEPGTVAHEAIMGPDSEGSTTYAVGDYWRRQVEAAEVRRDIAEAAHLGLQTRILAAEELAEAAEALAGTVRPLVPRLPVRQREAIYQAHGRALEALAAYRKAGT